MASMNNANHIEYFRTKSFGVYGRVLLGTKIPCGGGAGGGARAVERCLVYITKALKMDSDSADTCKRREMLSPVENAMWRAFLSIVLSD